MAVPYWILDRTRPSILEKGVVLVRLTDGRESKSVVLRQTEEAKAFLEANAYADGPDALFADLVWYWAVDRRIAIPGWIPANESIGISDVERFHALFEEDRKAHKSSPYPFWA